MRAILTILFAFSACLPNCGFFDPPTPEERGVKVNRDIHRVYNQDKAMLFAESAVEDYYGISLGHAFEDTKVWWADTRCPYSDNYAVVIEYNGVPDRCFYGIMFSCQEIYVAVSEHGKTCGTALLHEFGHCLYSRIFYDFDREHVDQEFWGIIGASAAESCDRGW